MSEQIKVLSDKDKARKRINVWHGSSSNWINMIKELTGNSLDIFEKIKLKTGIDKTQEIKIIIHNKNKIEFIDSATGIPVEGITDNGMPNYKAIFEVPFAGSNYDGEVATVGVNGVFIFSLAMTCEDIECFIARPDNNIYNVSYHKGDLVKDLNIIGKSDKTYTRMIFSLDEEVWDHPNFTFEEIKSIVKGQSSLSNVKITLEDLENNLKEEYYYKNGIEEYFNELTSEKTLISDNISLNKSIEQKITKNDTIDNIDVSMVFNFANDSNEPIQKDFLNTADLIQHGTIKDGIMLGFKNSINKWLKDNNKYTKTDKPITLDDIESSINYICNVKSLNAEYVSQVKQQTLSPHYKTALKIIIEEFMESYLIENKLDAERICGQILINSKARLSAEKTKANIRKKLEEKVNTFDNRVEGLVDCKIHGEEAELYITEGLSALGGCVLSRNPIFQAGMPIRGKILNCLKSSYEQIFKSPIITNLIKVIGCGIECDKKNKDLGNFDISKLRYGKIICLCDEDPDARSIVALILTMIYRLMPKLLDEGKVYVAKTPLFEIRNLETDEMTYAYSEEEKNKLIKRIKRYKVNRNKGIGEIDMETLSKTAMNPETRSLTKVDASNIDEMIKMFEVWMDTTVTDRKEYIENHLNEYVIED